MTMTDTTTTETDPPVELDPAKLAAGVYNDEGITDALIAGRQTDGRPGELIRTTRLEHLTHRPGWHQHHTPEPVSAAWEDLKATLDQLDDLQLRWETVGAAEAVAVRKYEAAVRVAASEDTKPPKPPTLGDQAEQRRLLEAEARALNSVAGERRRAYDQAVAANLATWQTTVIEATNTEATWAQTTQSWQKFRADLDVHQRSANLARSITRALDPTWGTLPTHDNQTADLRRRTAEHLDGVATYIGSSNPSIDGSDLNDPTGIEPPLSVRRWMAEQDPEWRRQLRAVEEAENFAITDHTRHDHPSGIPAGHTR